MKIMMSATALKGGKNRENVSPTQDLLEGNSEELLGNLDYTDFRRPQARLQLFEDFCHHHNFAN